MSVLPPSSLLGRLEDLLQDTLYVYLSPCLLSDHSRDWDSWNVSLLKRQHSSTGGLPKFAWNVFWPSLVIFTVWFLWIRENDQPIRYTVPSPKVPAKYEVLEQPAIKVQPILLVTVFARPMKPID